MSAECIEKQHDQNKQLIFNPNIYKYLKIVYSSSLMLVRALHYPLVSIFDEIFQNNHFNVESKAILIYIA